MARYASWPIAKYCTPAKCPASTLGSWHYSLHVQQGGNYRLATRKQHRYTATHQQSQATIASISMSMQKTCLLSLLPWLRAHFWPAFLIFTWLTYAQFHPSSCRKKLSLLKDSNLRYWFSRINYNCSGDLRLLTIKLQISMWRGMQWSISGASAADAVQPHLRYFVPRWAMSLCICVGRVQKTTTLPSHVSTSPQVSQVISCLPLEFSGSSASVSHLNIAIVVHSINVRPSVARCVRV